MRFGAQTVFYQPKGAYTGAVSAPMLKSLECEYVLVGHSERRSVFKETDEEINRSLKQVLENEMVPILCVGETLEQYESGEFVLNWMSIVFSVCGGSLCPFSFLQCLMPTSTALPLQVATRR